MINDVWTRAERFREALLSRGYWTPQSRCSEGEIRSIETRAFMMLPDSYKAFLKTFGKGAGEFLSHIDVYYDEIEGNLSFAGVTDKCHHPIPAHAFPVWVDATGEQLCFVYSNRGDDPEVYRLYTETGDFERVASSIWDVFEIELSILDELKSNKRD